MELVAETEPQVNTENIANEKKELVANLDFKMVTFSLAGKDYAIDIMNVKEIAKTGRFTFVPNTAHFVLGVYNLRGDIIPIIDLRLFFNIPVPERTNNEIEDMIIVTVEDQTFGIVVDAIDKVVGIQKSSIQPPHPLFGDINIKYIRGVVENNDRLYILLDIERIFGNRGVAEENKDENVSLSLVQQGAGYGQADNRKKAAAKPAEQKANKADSQDYSFIVSSLQSMKKFYTTSVNELWVKKRFEKWAQRAEKGSVQIQNIEECEEFLSDFYSPCNGKLWSSDYAAVIKKLMPENSAKQINVWDVGCGRGFETYSLACILKECYPESRIRIYAHDVDLISISNAPMLTVPEEAIPSWMKKYTVKAVNGSYGFTQEIKDMILFEYHDCNNNGNMPACDIIMARDMVSFLPENVQDNLFEQFFDELKGNGILILGENKSAGKHSSWQEKTIGSVVIYTK